MENEIRRIQLQERIRELEFEIESYYRKIRNINKDIHDCEREYSKAQEMMRKFIEENSIRNKINNNLINQSNLRCVRGLMKMGRSKLNGNEYRRTVQRMDDAIREIKKDILKFERMRENYKRELRFAEESREVVIRELSCL